MSENHSSVNGAPAPKDAPVFGIDLGTTFSCIARISPETGRPEVLPNLGGPQTTASVVYFESRDHITVGTEARRMARVVPDLVCACVKRDMGKPERRKYHGEEYSPEAISALILRKVIGDALEGLERKRDEQVKAVITVPAYFNAEEKFATSQAGQLAGVEVMYLAHEPVAAAVNYGFTRITRPLHLLVYDLGGGTFDVTVVWSDGSSARTIATDGDRLCGGIDWDREIVNWVRRRFEEENPGNVLPEDDPQLNQKLYEDAEQAKITLSERAKTTLGVHYKENSLAAELTVEEFERITAPLLEKTLSKTKSVLEAAKAKGVEKVDKVLLVGGSSRMKAVKERLHKLLGMEPHLHEPDLAIAKGAALLAGLIAEGKFKPDMTGLEEESAEGRLVTTVNSKSLGVEVYDRNRQRLVVATLIERNSELPASGSDRYAIVEAGQKTINLRVFEERVEPSEDPEENTLLHESPLELPAGMRKEDPIDVTFKLDASGILHVFVSEPRSDRKWEVKIDRFKRATSEDLKQLRPKLEGVK
jgi:molecular chaperone DnaK (HSP70)